MQLRDYEKKVFGFYLFHPVVHFRKLLKSMGVVKMTEIQNIEGVTYIIGEIISVKRRRTANNTLYAFVQVSDETGIQDMAIFSGLLNKTQDKIQEGNLVVMKIQIETTVKNSLSEKKITIQEILYLNEFLKQNSHEIKILIENKKQIHEIKNIIEKYSFESSLTRIMLEIDNNLIDTNCLIDDSIEFRNTLMNEGFKFC
jgi:DNA polymerase-3 subunit alpha